MEGPVYDLPCVMTKFLHLGMPLYDVIRATTEIPARAINKLKEFGSLTVGDTADITVLRLEEFPHDLEDSGGQVRRILRHLTPVYVWRAGQQYPVLPRHEPYPNSRKRKELTEHWEHLVIRDQNKPNCCWNCQLQVNSSLPWIKWRPFSQTIFSDAFSRMNIFVFWLRFHLSLLLRVQLTIIQLIMPVVWFQVFIIILRWCDN